MPPIQPSESDAGQSSAGDQPQAETNPARDFRRRVSLGSPEQSLIALCDEAADRRLRLLDMVGTRTGHPAMAVSLSFVPGKSRSSALVAVIGLTSPVTPDDAQIQWVARCKTAGYAVIAYADGARQWRIHVKCQLLLAGAVDLLDSAAENFPDRLGQLFDKVLKTSAERDRERQDLHSLMHHHGIVGECAALTDAFRSAVRFSRLSDLPVLITGDTGTGKELFARAIAAMDPKRKNGPFVAINCAAINPALFESEFFGHRRGAFTGAERDRPGLIRAANGGVLFLDEISELEAGMQAKLLRVLQENRLLSVGDDREVTVQVRFIGATNRNLLELVREQKFRLDLFHRLRALNIEVPPLRERADDLVALVKHFLRKHCVNPLAEILRASEDFMEAVRHLDFPGNVRQLEHLVCQALVNHQGGGDLDLPDLSADALMELTGPVHGCLETFSQAPPAPASVAQQSQIHALVKLILDREGCNLSVALSECEREVCRITLDRVNGNQSHAARLLGITPRSIYNKLQKHQLRSV